jgi:hypothetical protein
MAEIASLDAARRRRGELNRALADGAVMHPALRWTCDGAPYAHRRTRSGDTVCGLAGALVLAEPSERLCRDCYTVPVAATS